MICGLYGKPCKLSRRISIVSFTRFIILTDKTLVLFSYHLMQTSTNAKSIMADVTKFASILRVVMSAHVTKDIFSMLTRSNVKVK